jgi:hypothetical protein
LFYDVFYEDCKGLTTVKEINIRNNLRFDNVKKDKSQRIRIIMYRTVGKYSKTFKLPRIPKNVIFL